MEAFERIADRVARGRKGWQIVIDRDGFWARRVDQGPVGPSIFTNAEMIERHAITITKGPNLSSEERQREAARCYETRLVFGRAG